MKNIISLLIVCILYTNLKSQNVGIGTNTPQAKLHIIDNSTGNPLIISGKEPMYVGLYENSIYKGYFGSYINDGSNDDIDFGTGGGNITGKLHLSIQAVPKLTILPNGFTGINTTNPLQQLEVNGAIKIGNTANNELGSIRYNTGIFEGFNGTWNTIGSNWLRRGDTIINPSNTRVYLGDYSNNFAINFLQQNNKLVIVDTSDNIFKQNFQSIRLANPAQFNSISKFTTNADLGSYTNFYKNDYAFANGFTGGHFDVRTNTLLRGTAPTLGMFANSFSNAASSIGGLFFSSSGDSARYEGANFGNTGNYGIQTLASAYGSKNNVPVYGVYSKVDSGGLGRKYAGYFTVAGNGLGADTALKWAGFFNGNVAYTGTLSFASDERLKKNIKPLNHAINLISKLNATEYEFDNSKAIGMQLTNKKQFGLLAGDVEKIIPHLVTTNIIPAEFKMNEKMKWHKVTDEITYKGVNYIELIPLLIKGMQEQQLQIEALIAENEVIKKRLKEK